MIKSTVIQRMQKDKYLSFKNLLQQELVYPIVQRFLQLSGQRGQRGQRKSLIYKLLLFPLVNLVHIDIVRCGQPEQLKHMKNEKTTIKQALTMFNISRTSLYNHMKKLNIKPIKEGGRVHFVDTQIVELKAVLQQNCTPLNNDSEQVEQVEQVEQPSNSEKIYEKQIEELKKELQKERKENKKLIKEVGQWEGVARTLQDQNQKLLEVKIEEQVGTVDAEIIEPELATEKKAEKSGFFRKLFNLR